MAVGLEASGFWFREWLRALSLFLPCLFSIGAEFAVVFIVAIPPLLPTECHHQHIASVTQHRDNEVFHLLHLLARI
jgi:hypothetical protein